MPGDNAGMIQHSTPKHIPDEYLDEKNLSMRESFIGMAPNVRAAHVSMMHITINEIAKDMAIEKQQDAEKKNKLIGNIVSSLLAPR